MESSEGINPIENRELQLKASELAKVTREKGMGHIYGKFPLRFIKPYALRSYTWIGQFIQGEAETAEKHIDLSSMIRYRSANDELHTDYQIWRVSNYVPFTKILTVKEPRERTVPRHFGPFKLEGRKQTYYETVRKPTDEIITYKGKHGERGWTQYDYCMSGHPLRDPGRGAQALVMSIVVPPEVAAQIDEQINNNIYFPDALFKALYPDYVGSNVETHIKRVPATQITIVDSRQKPNKIETKKYPQPIPY